MTLNGKRPFATLQRFTRQAAEAAQAAMEHCDLCSEPIPSEHRHLLEVARRALECICRPCSILFNQEAASEGRYRLIPDRRLNLVDFDMSEAEWESLRIPVGMAFLFQSTAAGRVVAYYPGPVGATESLLELDTWDDLARRNPLLQGMQPDVEALLVNHARGARDHFLVPIDECYGLVGLIRSRWRGLGGGQEVWKEIEQFFDSLRGRSRTPRAESGAATQAGAAAESHPATDIEGAR